MVPVAGWLHDPAWRPHWRTLLALGIVTCCWLAFTPRPPELPIEQGDKVQHIAAFAALALCAALAQAPGRAARWRAAGGLLAFGVFIELVQAFLPTRSADAWDVLGDAVGIAAGLALAAGLRRRWPG